MNALKNLLIVAILAAAVCVVYISLQRNNFEPQQPSGVADGWSPGLKVELPGPKSSPGGPLALSGSSTRPNGASTLAPSGTARQHLVVGPPPTTGPANNPMARVPGMTPVAPYSSPTPTATLPAVAPSAIGGPISPASPTATLGEPMSPNALSAATTPNATTTLPNAAAPASGSPIASSGQAPPDFVRNLTPPPAATTPTNAASPTADPIDSNLQNRLAAFMEAVQKKLDEGKLAESHVALSKLYRDTDLPADYAKQITSLLDQLAGTVIYSRRHYLEPPYMTQQGDTLDRVAQRYNVPWQLLARINGLMPPNAPSTDTTTKDQPLPAGMELKVVRGPFDAVVRLDKRELTLMVQDRYAGRFSIGIGRDESKLDGDYTVRNKTLSPPYYGPDGVNMNPNDPKNPLGAAWIGLTDRIGIHGVNDPKAVGRDDNRGTICVGDRDLQDLYGILSVGSRVQVMR